MATKSRRVRMVFGGLANSTHESKTPTDRCFASHNVNTDLAVLQAREGTTLLASVPSTNANDVCFGAGYGKYSGNEIQKLLLTGNPTGGTFTLTWSGQTTAALARTASAADVQSAIEALSNINVGDVRVSGGPINALPIYVEFRGQYANTDVAAMTANSAGLTGGTTPTVTPSEYIKGGSFEQYVVMVQKSGDTTCTLYKVTSSDSFAGTITYTSIGTGFSASDWFFQQYAGTIYGVNVTDGVVKIPFGGTVVSNISRPATPQNVATYATGNTSAANQLVDFTSATAAFSGWQGTSPDVTIQSGGKGITFTNGATVQDSAQVTATLTLNADQNWQYRDFGLLKLTAGVTSAQTLYVEGGGGYIILTFNGQSTGHIAYNAANSAIATALNALSNIGTGGVVVSGGPLPNGQVTITFTKFINAPAITVDFTNLTAGAAGAFAYITPVGAQGATQLDIDPSSVRMEWVNDDGSPVTMEAQAYGRDAQSHGSGNYQPSWDTYFDFFDFKRANRANVKKLKLYFTLKSMAAGIPLNVTVSLGDNWLADTLAATMPASGGSGSQDTATKATFEYLYTYYNVAQDLESNVSPTLATNSIGLTLYGQYVTLTVSGNKGLATTDKIYIYRREKATGKLRRLPNADGTYGIANVTSGTTTFVDHNMEHEIAVYPEPTVTNFSSGSSSAAAEQIGVWKGSLVIGGKKQAWFSRVGAPGTFAPSPDDNPDNASLLLQGPGRAVTEYVSDNRGENILNISGQDSLYITTDTNTYGAIGDQPSDIIAFRKIRSSRGSLGYRAACAYNGSLLVATKHGLWEYRASRYLASADGSTDADDELTKEVRRSWSRLLGPWWFINIQNLTLATGGTFTITFQSQTTQPISWPASTADVKAALESLTNINVNEVDVIYPGVNGFYIRLVGQFVGKTISSSALTCDTSGLVGTGSLTNGVTQICAGGSSSVVIAEFNDGLWCFNGAAYLSRSRNGAWSEGAIATVAVKVAVPTRQNGLIFFSTIGNMYRIEDKANTDHSIQIGWSYQTGINISPRSRLTAIHACVEGAVTLMVTRDDVAGGRSVETFTITSAKEAVLGVNILPAIKHTLAFIGGHYSDKVLECDFVTEGEGDGYGS